MLWHYMLVFLGSMAVDVVPFPLPPAFTVMMILQIVYKLDVWTVIAVGVAGSVAGRFILSLYVPKLSGRVFNPAKNKDVQYLGHRLQKKGWRTHLLILAYSLMPLPTTPLFIAAGMARLQPLQIFPGFILGKLVSDAAAVWMAKGALSSTDDLVDGMVSAKSIAGLIVGLLLLFALFFFDWRTLLQRHRLRVKFNVWK